MSKKPTYFLDEWLSSYFWVQKVQSNKQKARCKLCAKDINLSTMGVKALHSHESGEKHKARVRAMNVHPIEPHVTKQLPTSNEGSLALSTLLAPSLPLVVDTQLAPSHDESATNSACAVVSCRAAGDSPAMRDLRQSTLQRFLLAEQVTRAEVIWVIHCVLSHESQRSAANAVYLFALMFTDSEIASKMQLQRTKIGYFVNHGLSPHFPSELRKSLLSCDFLVFCFDESLNKVAQRQQMDIHVRFWNALENTVNCRYLTSVFLGHARATDLLVSFQDAIGDTLLKRALQVSMDGPNVNHKFLKLFIEAQESKPDPCSVLDLGSCGLHVVHGAVKTGLAATDWSLMEFLRAAYNLFKDVPSRRADFIRYSGSEILPLKCCPIRWVENIPVAQRCLTLLLCFKKYIDSVEKNKAALKCKSYIVFKKSVEDKLFPCKLAFFLSICEHTQPFLKEFQTDRPYAVFLYDAVSDILRTFLQMFVKEDALNEASSLSDIDLSEKSDQLLTAKPIKLGFSVKDAIRTVRSSVKDVDILMFRQDCRTALISLTKKLFERSPVKYRLVKAISCFDPALIVSKERLALKRLATFLEELVRTKWLKGAEGDRAEKQFKDFIKRPDVGLSLKQFRRETDRIDSFYMDLLKADNKNEELKRVIRLVCTFSHGNAAAERGFSINKECIVENQHELSLISQRMVYDTITVSGGIDKFEVTKSVIHAVRNSHAMYKEYSEKKKNENLENNKQDREKKRILEEAKELEMKKVKVMADARKETEMIDAEIASLTQPKKK